jgi:DNA polymerase (family 10)
VTEERDHPTHLDGADGAGDRALEDVSDAPAERPAPDGADEPTVLTNDQLARVFHEIGDILEVKGELVFKTVAYHRAADAIAKSPFEVARAYRDGTPPTIPGVGKAISDKIAELATTGRLEYHERLRGEFPPNLIDLLEVPGVGPKSVRAIHEGLGVESLEDLRQAALAGRLRSLRGFSAKSEAAVLAGIAALEARQDRLLIHRAEAAAEIVLAALRTVAGVRSVEVAGSLRRGRETIGDLDILAETEQPEALVERFTTLADVERVLGAGSHKAAIVLRRGPQVDLMIMPPGAAGTYRIHFTGSKEHNVRLRGMARDLGWSLSEHGFLRIGETDAATADQPPVTPTELKTYATETEAYAFLGLPFIPPELREDEGEIEAALAGRLPDLVRLRDLRGDLHSHSDWSDGVHTVERMAEAARRRGHAYQVLTDHSVSLAIARGLDPERFSVQRAMIDALNARFAAEAAEGRLPEGVDPGFRLLQGCELEVRADGTLDLPDTVLAAFDVVVASVHVGRRQPRAQLTARTLSAIESPHVDVIAHPSGRMIQGRDDLDLDWDAVFDAAARTGTALEINGSPHRLDLSAERARRAIAAGCIVSIDSDAHRTEEYEHLRWGVVQARRGWVTPGVVLNSRSLDELLDWVAAKPDRVGG